LVGLFIAYFKFILRNRNMYGAHVKGIHNFEESQWLVKTRVSDGTHDYNIQLLIGV